MDRDGVLAECLALLAGELRDASGAVLTAASSELLVTRPDDEQRAAIAGALSSGRRVVVCEDTAPGEGPARLVGWLTCRARVARARRWLLAAGATHVRTLAVVPGHESLLLVYELAGTAQPYLEQHVVPGTPGAPWWRRATKTLVSRLTGVDVSVAMVVVVGERG